jgi:hypothetical protein
MIPVAGGFLQLTRIRIAFPHLGTISEKVLTAQMKE